MSLFQPNVAVFEPNMVHSCFQIPSGKSESWRIALLPQSSSIARSHCIGCSQNIPSIHVLYWKEIERETIGHPYLPKACLLFWWALLYLDICASKDGSKKCYWCQAPEIRKHVSKMDQKHTSILDRMTRSSHYTCFFKTFALALHIWLLHCLKLSSAIVLKPCKPGACWCKEIVWCCIVWFQLAIV